MLPASVRVRQVLHADVPRKLDDASHLDSLQRYILLQRWMERGAGHALICQKVENG
jgi:hypothetical protein